MLSNVAQAAVVTSLLDPLDHADTASATGDWTAITDYEGFIIVTSCVGVVTAGQIAGKLQHADDDQGTNAADVTGGGFTTVTTSNDPMTEKVVVNSNGLKPYIRYLGTITTGPVAASVTMAGVAKYV